MSKQIPCSMIQFTFHILHVYKAICMVSNFNYDIMIHHLKMESKHTLWYETHSCLTKSSLEWPYLGNHG